MCIGKLGSKDEIFARKHALPERSRCGPPKKYEINEIAPTLADQGDETEGRGIKLRRLKRKVHDEAQRVPGIIVGLLTLRSHRLACSATGPAPFRLKMLGVVKNVSLSGWSLCEAISIVFPGMGSLSRFVCILLPEAQT